MDVHPVHVVSGMEVPDATLRNYWPANKPDKVDRATFNYGRALGTPKGQHRAEYEALQSQARAWAEVARQFSVAAWALEMALKRTRDGETLGEQHDAMQEAREIFHDYDRKLERVESGPCKWFRYGRTGNVLSRFAPRWRMTWTSPHNG